MILETEISSASWKSLLPLNFIASVTNLNHSEIDSTIIKTHRA